MRDVLIWVMALRIAEERDGAFVVSGDPIFWTRSDDVLSELRKAGLRRFRSLSTAIGDMTLVGTDVLDLLARLVPALVGADVPINNPPSWRTISQSSIVRSGGSVKQLRAVVTCDAAEPDAKKKKARVAAGQEAPGVELELRLERDGNVVQFELIEGTDGDGNALKSRSGSMELEDPLTVVNDPRSRLEQLKKEMDS